MPRSCHGLYLCCNKLLQQYTIIYSCLPSHVCQPPDLWHRQVKLASVGCWASDVNLCHLLAPNVIFQLSQVGVPAVVPADKSLVFYQSCHMLLCFDKALLSTLQRHKSLCHPLPEAADVLSAPEGFDCLVLLCQLVLLHQSTAFKSNILQL